MKTILSLVIAGSLLASPALAGGRHGNSGGGTGIGIGNANSSSSAGASASSSNRWKDRYQAPGVASVGLTSTGACPIGSVGFGISGPGAGIGFGTTKGDKLCRDAFLMETAGFGKAALRQYVVDQVPEIAAAVRRSQPAPRVQTRAAPVAASGVDARCPSGAWSGGVVGGRCLY